MQIFHDLNGKCHLLTQMHNPSVTGKKSLKESVT